MHQVDVRYTEPLVREAVNAFYWCTLRRQQGRRVVGSVDPLTTWRVAPCFSRRPRHAAASAALASPFLSP